MRAVTEAAAIRTAFQRGAPLDAAEDGVHLRLDGARPFLVIVRDAGAGDALFHLVRGEASYLRAEPGADPRIAAQAARLVATCGAERHGTFLLIELWGGDDGTRLLAPDGPAPATVRTLARELQDLPGAAGAPVDVVGTDSRHPPELDPLIEVSRLHEMGALLLGVELPESWRDPETGERFPVHLRRLAHALSAALRSAAFEFLRVQTETTLSSYRALGRRSLGEPVWEADRRLAAIDGAFDPLLLVAPVNARAAWERFRDSGYAHPPEFRYRLLPVSPDLLKRELYEIRLEDVDDPAAWKLLHDKREELDRQISLIADRGSADFLHGAIRLFGPVEASLRDRAVEILATIGQSDSPARNGRADAQTFAGKARLEFDAYADAYPGFRSEVQVRPDLVGLMVSSGRLLVGQDLTLDAGRVDALIQHEVGTHVLTYVNGAAQPFLQLARGFAAYDETQEGLGVLAEYLVGGLTAARMRLLAARVLAVDWRIHGADFIETFRRLCRDYGFAAWEAFDIATRVHSSGGFTRDHIYLRGLADVIEYLRDGGPVEPLYVGKIAIRHLEVVEELRERGVLNPIPLMPRFLDRPAARERLQALRDGLPLHAMVSEVGAAT